MKNKIMQGLFICLFVLSLFGGAEAASTSTTFRDCDTYLEGTVHLSDASLGQALWIAFYEESGQLLSVTLRSNPMEEELFTMDKSIHSVKIMLFNQETLQPVGKEEEFSLFQGCPIVPSANVAVIESVGSTVIDGEDEVTVVEFWKEGELQSAYLDQSLLDSLGSASRGDVFQLTLKDDVIIAANKVLDYN